VGAPQVLDEVAQVYLWVVGEADALLGRGAVAALDVPNTSPSFTTRSMKGAYVVSALLPAYKTSRPSALRSKAGAPLLSYRSSHGFAPLGEVRGGANVVGVPSRGFHGYGVMEGAARTSARRHYWLWVMERRRQPKNEKRAPAMVMELGRGAAQRLRVTQHGY
jgi:hypothetical protein